ncbi:DUF3224 domain-containing protein [Pseudomonas huaxiensis]|uniref:DUF3224 domain-containing protein n=1 Tax=Pseudomonas huaxiensis TaxID=2213017 RepID=UPI000DA66662|nr:DUF3224 domain-containing protein [Pseudomonas huaxiensis]
MEASATFSTRDFTPTGLSPVPEITTALPVSVSTMEKTYSGDISGTSSTVFTAAFDPTTRTGSYIALESFDGTVNGRQGTFNFIHSASTTGTNRADEFFSIVAGSGTGDLQGISGTGGIKVDADGTHRIWLDYQLG